MKAGRAVVRGSSGGYLRLTRDVLSISAQMVRQDQWKTLLIPLMTILPAITLATVLGDMAFARYWSARAAGAPVAAWRTQVLNESG